MPAVLPLVTSTGSAILPDLGQLSYNGVTFSSLFKTRISGEALQDEASRTVKYVKYTLDVDGFVTLPPGATSIDNTMVNLRLLLDAEAGRLTYLRKGFGPLDINAPGGLLKDVQWGPKPQTIEFLPMGAANGALVRWVVVFCLPEYAQRVLFGGLPNPFTANNPLILAAAGLPPALQFNYEISIAYDEDGYTSLSLRGTLEVPQTRTTQNQHQGFTYTVDDYRQKYLDTIADSFDLTNFKVSKRTFTVSRDRRSMDWEFIAEEQAYMNLPYGCTRARGTFSVRPQKQGMALCNWICSMRCTYTVRKDVARRIAWAAFISLWQFRMKQSKFGVLPQPNQQQNPGAFNLFEPGNIIPGIGNIRLGLDIAGNLLKIQQNNDNQNLTQKLKRLAFPVSFEVDEGLYEDSRTITFGSTWVLFTTMTAILKATGVWRWANQNETATQWATTMRDIQGWRSWMANRIDPATDLIVDTSAGL